MLRTFAILLAIISIGLDATAQAQRPGRPMLRRGNPDILRTKPTREQKQKLEPLQQDVTAFGELLKQPKTGIFRLFPDLGCNDNLNVVRADEQCLEAFAEGSFYSFREREHTLRALADLRFRSDFLYTDGILSQGIIVGIGDVAIEKASLTAEGLQFISEFAPKTDTIEAQRQYLEILKGVNVGKYRFAKSVKVVENSTYLLRVIAYRGNLYRNYNGFRIDLLEGDKRIDITVAFRVVRKAADGGVTLIWRELDRRDAPRMTVQRQRPQKS